MIYFVDQNKTLKTANKKVVEISTTLNTQIFNTDKFFLKIHLTLNPIKGFLTNFKII